MFPNFHEQGELFSQTAKVLVDSVGRNTLTLVARDMGLELENVVRSAAFENEASDFLLAMSRQQRVTELIAAARRRNTDNRNLMNIETRVASWWNGAFGTALGIDVESGAYELQCFVRPHLGDMSMDDWIERVLDVRRAVCRVTTKDGANGTGFLIGSDLVLTAKHVLDRKAAATCFFDDDQNATETTDRQATRIALQESDLDYALLRLDHSLKDRKHLSYATTQPKKDDPLVVVQHPGGGKKRIAQGSVKGTPDQYLEHNANTSPGTSGAPCFDAHWRVIGIHREGKDGNKNRALSITAVLDNLPQGMLPA